MSFPEHKRGFSGLNCEIVMGNINLQSINFSGLLSGLTIDSDKDWQEKDITNMGDVNAVGNDVMLNGGFDTSDDWTFGGDWSWVTDHAELDVSVTGNTGDLVSDTSIESGATYLLTFDAEVYNCTQTITAGGVSVGTASADGSYSFSFTTTNTDSLTINGYVNSTKKARCKVDNVTLTQIRSWTGGVNIKAGLLESNLNCAGNGSQNIGSDDKGIGQIYIGNDTSTAVNLPGGFRGLAFKYTNGDGYIGNDNVYPGYYVQKTVVHDSTVKDNSEDYTNLYQGDSAYKRVSMMYDIPWSGYYTGSINGVEFSYTENDSCPLFIGSKMIIQQKGSDAKMIISSSLRSTTIAFLEIGLSHTTYQEAVRPDTDALIDLGDTANTLRWRNGYFSGIVDAATNFAVGGTNGVSGWFDDGANFRITVTGGIITAIGDSVAGGHS